MDAGILSFRGEYFYLSNFFARPLFHADLGRAATAEHAFNALKTLDPRERAWVLAATTPAQAKRRGRGVHLRQGWDEGLRVQAMRSVLDAKFGDPQLRGLLMATGTAALVEGNTHHDNFWGDCQCGGAACGSAGRNQLGVLLVELRETLRASS